MLLWGLVLGEEGGGEDCGDDQKERAVGHVGLLMR